MEFERSKARENRLVLGFYETQTRRKVRVNLRRDVRIPTGLMVRKDCDVLEERVACDEALRGFKIWRKQIANSDFYVLSICLPYVRSLVERLPKKFQIGDYEKLVKFGGFFPERKVVLCPDLEKRFQQEENVDLDDLAGMDFGGFLTAEEFSSLPSVVIDIEKNLWKNDEEKKLLDEWERLTKLEDKYQKEIIRSLSARNNHEDTTARVLKLRELEKKLTIDVEDVGSIGLFDGRYDAKVSSVTTIWSDSKRKEQRRVYFLDPHKECRHETFNGFSISCFLLERSEILAIRTDYRIQSPIISWGHNQVYDNTQLRFAADERQILYDIGVKDMKPRRDFVRLFMQRLKENLFFMDTMYIANILAPHLKQRSFGCSLKLADVCEHFGVPFQKSQSHENLRGLKLRHLAGRTEEIRQKAIYEDLRYATEDVLATRELSQKLVEIFSPLMSRIKQAAPFLTSTEIAFSPRCLHKLHEYIYFQRTGALPYKGYKQKERLDKERIFKKRFASLKKDLLDYFNLRKVKGEHVNVGEYYLSLEEMVADFTLTLSPELRQAYESLKREYNDGSFVERTRFIGFLQYLRAFTDEVFVDYYFARREKKTLDFALHIVKSSIPLNRKNGRFIEDINLGDNEERINHLVGSFRYLKNHFRSIYSALILAGKSSLLRPTRKNLEGIDYPEIAEKDSDLYLLRESASKISPELSSQKQRELQAFLTNFDKFEEIIQATGLTFEEVYLHLYNQRFRVADRQFFGKYGFSVENVRGSILRGYDAVANSLMESGKVVDVRGDYLFIQGDYAELERTPFLYPVRYLSSYDVK